MMCCSPSAPSQSPSPWDRSQAQENYLELKAAAAHFARAYDEDGMSAAETSEGSSSSSSSVEQEKGGAAAADDDDDEVRTESKTRLGKGTRRRRSACQGCREKTGRTKSF